MLFKLKEKDFAALREPLDSGRQSPTSLGGALLLLLFFHPLVYYLTYYVAAETTIYPNVEKIQNFHFWLTVSLVVLCALYAIPAIYKRSQKMQYLLSILSSQNIAGFSFYLIVIFIVGDGNGITVEDLMSFIKVTLTLGILVFLITCIRFYILLKKGHYRADSKKARLRANFEMKSYLPLFTAGGVSFVFLIQYVFRHYHLLNADDWFIVILGMSLFYVMIFVLPEQLVILYCKFRFKSFNFSRTGYLNPINKKE